MRTLLPSVRMPMSRVVKVGWVAVCLLFTTACHLEMYDQPKADPYESSALYADGAGSRPPQPNTVSRGANLDTTFTTGIQNGQFIQNPVTVNEQVIARGKERYGIACITCHGALANGKGAVASYFRPAPASMYAQYLRDAPDGYIFNVITHGKGQMYPLNYSLSVEDRWAIIAYIRTLQANPPEGLSEADRQPTDYPPTFRVPGTAQPNQPELPGR